MLVRPAHADCGLISATIRALGPVEACLRRFINPDQTVARAGIRRWATAFVVGLLPTFVLLWVMTTLIGPLWTGPVGHRPTPTLDIRLRTPAVLDVERRLRPERPRPSEPPPPSAETPPSAAVDKAGQTPSIADERSADGPIEPSRLPAIDWRAEALEVIRELDDPAERARRWRLDNGYDRYVSIMQGPPPAPMDFPKNPDAGRDAGAAGYVNIYGEREIRLNENCVVVSSEPLDHIDIMGNLPAKISCKPTRRDEWSLDLPGPSDEDDSGRP